MKEFKSSGVDFVVDPTERLVAAGAIEARLEPAAGILLPWALEYFSEREVNKQIQALVDMPVLRAAALLAGPAPSASLFDFMRKKYSFPMMQMTGGTITEDLLHTYSEDPDMAPLVVVTDDGKPVFLIYQYSIVAFADEPSPGEWYITRMD